MKQYLLTAAILALAILIFLVCSKAPMRDDEAACYAWFDTLGFPDLAACPYVQIATGRSFQSGDRPPENSYYGAFLLQDEGDRFRVFTLDLQTLSYQKTAPGTVAHERVGYEEANLRKQVEEYLPHLERPAEDWNWRLDISALGWESGPTTSSWLGRAPLRATATWPIGFGSMRNGCLSKNKRQRRAELFSSGFPTEWRMSSCGGR
jgi:hypothetical protein